MARARKALGSQWRAAPLLTRGEMDCDSLVKLAAVVNVHFQAREIEYQGILCDVLPGFQQKLSDATTRALDAIDDQ
jgi:hypothetical protein